MHQLSDGFNVEPRLSIAHQSAPISRLDSTPPRLLASPATTAPLAYPTNTHNNAKTSLHSSITLAIIARDIIVCYCAPLITHLCLARRYESNRLSRSIGEHYRFHSWLIERRNSISEHAEVDCAWLAASRPGPWRWRVQRPASGSKDGRHVYKLPSRLGHLSLARSHVSTQIMASPHGWHCPTLTRLQILSPIRSWLCLALPGAILEPQLLI